ncbi:MAG: R3H domain-containing nucleic acid-binding protein [bacterium]
MLAFERKIIHMALKNNQYVTTYSIGENPYKSVVIAPLLDTNNLA